ncbi:MAG: YkgJ family cysteine cluster protein [Desulfobacterales bacterium]|nr:YkgJ family cysteine cluster protein [Desulfobacterales bacterium]MBF0395634.1 YkgJ family cysteine cluster protein [Desulfobacterales bacterium]
MEIPNNMSKIKPESLSKDHEFKFECHKGNKCFTHCCRDINITLTPYDIIRLKNRLNLSSEEFLAIYTNPNLLEKTDLPIITLKLLDDEEHSCPFIKETGCLVYNDRPTACRYYPVGFATLPHREDIDEANFYFLITESHCLGFKEEKIWTVNNWRKDQGVDIHDEINYNWADLIVRKRSFPPNIKLTEQTKQMFFLASYNIDKFKKFIFESSFFKRYEIPENVIERIKTDEVELLKFGMEWLKLILFKIETPIIKIKNPDGKI